MPPTEPRTDQELLAAINRGDVHAFDALYFRYRDWVVRLAHRFAGHEDDALDVLQETFAYLLRKFPGFRLTSAMTTFLYPVVKHLALGARRKRHRMIGGAESLLDRAASSSGGPSPTGPNQGRDELATVLSALPEAQREVLLMRFVDGMSMQEIAVALCIPPGTVKSRIHNAIQSLRSDPKVALYFES